MGVRSHKCTSSREQPELLGQISTMKRASEVVQEEESVLVPAVTTTFQ